MGFTRLGQFYRKIYLEKFQGQFIGQFYTLQWIVREMESPTTTLEKHTSGKADDVSLVTVKAQVESIPELVRGCKLQYVRKMDEVGLVFVFSLILFKVGKVECKKGEKSYRTFNRYFFFATADG